jgi:hypothetical protein
MYIPTDRLTTLSGNNRGNRYSHKHLRLKPSEDEYWNFSIDELARYAGLCFGPEIGDQTIGRHSDSDVLTLTPCDDTGTTCRR